MDIVMGKRSNLEGKRSNLEGKRGKLLEDLPTTVSDKYSSHFISLCNKHRAKYKQEVAFLKEVYADLAVMVNNKTMYNNMDYSLNIYDRMPFCDRYKNFMYAYLHEDRTCQKLVRADIKKDTPFMLSCEYSMITAFYLPKEHSGWIGLFMLGNVLIGQYHGYQTHEIDLDDVLCQSKTVPSWDDGDNEFLEYILFLSRQGRIGVIHRRQEEIEIDGSRYVRILFVQPFLPLDLTTHLYNFFLKSDNDVTIYLEANNVDYDKNLFDAHTLWCPEDPDIMPLIWNDSYITCTKQSGLLNEIYVDLSVFTKDVSDIELHNPSMLTDDPNMSLHYDYY